MQNKTISVILPCLNEEAGIAICIKKINEVFSKENIKGELIVVDNNSTDKSPEIARSMGAKVVFQPIRGYGAAYIKGLDEAGGDYLIIADADDTYDFYQIPQFVKTLDEGYDLVMGNRFKGNMAKGAMTFSHRYIGNPIITFVFRVFFQTHLSDIMCGMRAFTKEAYKKMELKCLGMEFATEMVFAGLRQSLKMAEVPANYFPRKGETKLRSLEDAWRHFRFMLLFSPDWLFIVPGMTLFILGFIALLLAGWGHLNILGHRFDTHSMVFFTFFSLLGFQIVTLGLFAKTYSLLEGLGKRDKLLEKLYRKFNLEKGLTIGAGLALIGFFISIYILSKWIKMGFGPLDEIKFSLVSLLLMILGIQTIFSSFFISILLLPRKKT
jgi:glycosyltransferase involved in cell wall biosynthesis